MKSLKYIFILAVFTFITAVNTAQANTYVSDYISESETWTVAESPYIVNDVTIPSGVTLTINPGVVVKVASKAIAFDVDGILNVGSNSGSRVYITSINDNTGGATGNGSPQPEDWKDIVINSGGSVNLVNTTVRYGGAVSPYNKRLIYNNGDLSLNNTTLSNSRSILIFQSNTSATLNIYNSTLTTIPTEYATAIMANQGDVSVFNTTFNSGGTAISISQGWLDLGNNNFNLEHDTDWAVYGSVGKLRNSGNNTGNGLFGIWFNDLNEDIILPKDGVTYYFTNIKIPVNGSLTVGPGAKVRIPGSRIDIYGSLTLGSVNSSDPVILTSQYDDASIGKASTFGQWQNPSPGDWMGIKVWNGGTLTVNTAKILYGGQLKPSYIDAEFCTPQEDPWGETSYVPDECATGYYYESTILNEGGIINVKNLTVSNSQGHGIRTNSGTTTIINSKFTDSPVGVSIYGGKVSYSNNTFTNVNTEYSNNGGVLAEDNSSNFSNIMFLPGIMGSDLYSQSGEKCWPNIVNNSRYSCIEMIDSTTPRTQGVVTRDTLGAVYSGLKDRLNEWQTKYGIIATSTPYDWRYGIDHIVNSGVMTSSGIDYNQENNSPYLVNKFIELASSSPSGKVTIIAHSMGGLVTKALTSKLETLGLGNKVDQIILIATPQLGTPKAVATLLHGTDSEISKFYVFTVLSNEEARGLSQNMESAIELLPSNKYFNSVDDPVITMSSTTPTYASLVQAFGDTIHDSTNMNSFLSNVKWGIPEYSDIETPSVISSGILNNASAFHNTYDNWTPRAGVNLITISGSGLDTISGINYTGSKIVNGREIPTYTISTTQNGDETVVTPSAQYRNGVLGGKYFIDLLKYNDDYSDREHSDITEINELQTLLERLSTGSTTPVSYEYITTEEPAISATSSRLHFVLHSPLTLGFRDSKGNFTGLTSEGIIKNDIPNSQYERIGEIQWMSLPKDIKGELVMKGTDEGTFDLEVREELNGKILNKTTFVDIPVSKDTDVTMDINSSDITKAGDMKVDNKVKNNKENHILRGKIGEVVKIKKDKIDKFDNNKDPYDKNAKFDR